MGQYKITTDQGEYLITTDEPTDTHPALPDTGKSLNLAGMASQAVTPPEQPQGSFLSRMVQGTKDMVAPSMDSLKRLINPLAGQFGMSRVLEGAGQQVGRAVRGSASNIADTLATNPNISKIVANAAMPGAGSIPNVGPAMGAGLSTAADVASNQLTPSAMQQNLGAEGIGMAPKAMAADLTAAGLPKAMEQGAKDLGVTSIFNKSKLYSNKSPFETMRKMANAGKSVDAMLKQGAMDATGDTGGTIQNVLKMKTAAESEMNSVIDGLKSKVAVPTDSIAQRLTSELPKQFPNQEAIVGSIVNDLKSFEPPAPHTHGAGLGDNPFSTSDFPTPNEPPPKVQTNIGLRELQTLKKRWGDKGYQMLTVNTDAAKLFRRASDIAENLISETIKSAGGPDSVARYSAARSQDAVAFTALGGLTERLAAEAGNTPFSVASLGSNLSKRAFRAASPNIYNAAQTLKTANPVLAAPRVGLQAILAKARQKK